MNWKLIFLVCLATTVGCTFSYFGYKNYKRYAYSKMTKQERELNLYDSIKVAMFRTNNPEYIYIPADDVSAKKMLTRFGLKNYCIYIKVADSLDNYEYNQKKAKWEADSLVEVRQDSLWREYLNSDCNTNTEHKKFFKQAQKESDSTKQAKAKKTKVSASVQINKPINKYEHWLALQKQYIDAIIEKEIERKQKQISSLN